MIGTTVKLGFDGAAVERGLAGLKSKFSSLAKSMKADFSRAFVIGGIGAGAGIGIAKSMLDIAAGFESALAKLKIVEGSAEKAQESFEWIQKFAKDTPYELDEVTQAFIALKSKGLDPMANDSLRILGDAAVFAGDMKQAVEAIGDAMLGAGDRLAEAFLINQKTEGNKVSFFYTDKQMNAQVATVEKGNKAIIASTLLAILNDKYKGAMAEQSKTWNGMVSNMKDAWAGFAYKIMMSGPFLKLKEQLRGFLAEIDKMDADGRLQAWANDIGTKMIKAGEEIWALGKGIATVVTTVKDLVGGWGNLGYVMLAANFAPTIKLIVEMTTALKLMSAATWAAVGPWAALAAAIYSVYDVMNDNKIGKFITDLFSEDSVLKAGDILNNIGEGLGSKAGFIDRLNNIGRELSPTSSADTSKQLEEQIRILKDIRTQGNFTVLA
jgi:phage tail tape-measure protein